MPHALDLLAGPDALRLVRERGLRAEDVDVVPAASGGPKWLVLAGLDRVLFGSFLQAQRTRPLHLVGSSIGSWRLACLAQRDPVHALDQFEEAYIEQRYPPKPSAALVTQTSREILDRVLGPGGAEQLIAHPWARLHVVTARCRGLLASERRGALFAGLAGAAALNLASRRTLALQLQRVIFHSAGADSPLQELGDLPTVHVPLTAENVREVLLASGAIPLVMQGLRIPGAPPGLYRDGGLVDYHLDLDYGPGSGLLLYPHFYPHLVPGWFDKALPWRRAGGARFRRALLLAPSASFVASLPGGKIPDRTDFARMSDADRIRAWRTVRAASARLGEEFGELTASGRLADRLVPLFGETRRGAAAYSSA